jgi:hypothetical protein
LFLKRYAGVYSGAASAFSAVLLGLSIWYYSCSIEISAKYLDLRTVSATDYTIELELTPMQCEVLASSDFHDRIALKRSSSGLYSPALRTNRRLCGFKIIKGINLLFESCPISGQGEAGNRIADIKLVYDHSKILGLL